MNELSNAVGFLRHFIETESCRRDDPLRGAAPVVQADLDIHPKSVEMPEEMPSDWHVTFDRFKHIGKVKAGPREELRVCSYRVKICERQRQLGYERCEVDGMTLDFDEAERAFRP